jgi:hypothetical protein
MTAIPMHSNLPALISVLVAMPAGLQAQPVDLPLPTRDALREIELQAYACSRENISEPCERTKTLSNPLMDHPRLSAACKDTVWELLQVATVVPSNNYKRRDSIDSPARRLTVVCGAQKPAQPASPAPRAINPNQT